MAHQPESPEGPRRLRDYVLKALLEAHRRRPTSFYLLLVTPVVLLLARDLFRHQDDPKRFALGLSLLFIFFGVVVLRALMDMLDIARHHVREHRQSFRETLGDTEFVSKLAQGIAGKPSSED